MTVQFKCTVERSRHTLKLGFSRFLTNCLANLAFSQCIQPIATVLISIISIQLPLISKYSHQHRFVSLFAAFVRCFFPHFFFYTDFELIGEYERTLSLAYSFSIGIDIQIIVYSLASTPSRLICLDGQMSSNFNVVAHFSLFLFSFHCFLCSLGNRFHLT